MKNDREFVHAGNLTLKERNAKRKQLEADGWTIYSQYGNKRYGWTLEAWKGEKPSGTRTSIALTQHGENGITPMYGRGVDREYMDGTPF